jgi:hypothetical protein
MKYHNVEPILISYQEIVEISWKEAKSIPLRHIYMAGHVPDLVAG